MKKVYIVRDTEYGNIDSIWLSEDKALKRTEDLKKLMGTSKYTRTVTWVKETWEIQDS